MRYLQGVLSFLLFALLVGCGSPTPTVSYNTKKDQTSFQTGSMTVAQDVTGSSFSTTSLSIHAAAECSGRNCTPNTVQLTFEVQGGSSNFTFSNQSVSFVADGEEYTWSQTTKWDNSDDVRTFQGQKIQLEMPLSKLEKIVEASSLSGHLGNKPLNLQGRVQSRLQAFVQKTKNPTSSPETS